MSNKRKILDIKEKQATEIRKLLNRWSSINPNKFGLKHKWAEGSKEQGIIRNVKKIIDKIAKNAKENGLKDSKKFSDLLIKYLNPKAHNSYNLKDTHELLKTVAEDVFTNGNTSSWGEYLFEGYFGY